MLHKIKINEKQQSRYRTSKYANKNSTPTRRWGQVDENLKSRGVSRLHIDGIADKNVDCRHCIGSLLKQNPSIFTTKMDTCHQIWGGGKLIAGIYQENILSRMLAASGKNLSC